MTNPEQVKDLIESAGGKVDSMTVFSDGHGCATASFPLPKNHWLYEDKGFNVPPMPFRCGVNESYCARLTRDEWAEKINEAGKYAVRCATMNGKEQDFDPDALLQNLVVGFLGYWTENGLSSDDFANPKETK
jgi:hypothetical protein